MKEDTYKGEVQRMHRGWLHRWFWAVPGRGAHTKPIPGLTDSPSQQQEPANFAMDLEEKLGAWNRDASAGWLWLP